MAAHYSGARSIITVTVDAPPPGPHEVQLAPAFTGICGTDLHIFHGDMDSRVAAPAVIGHETAGCITAIGDGVSGWSVGDPVTVMPIRWDGTCPACVAGHRHVCQNLDFMGIDSPGAMQERWTVPAGTLVRLPQDLALDAAALVEPTAVAVHDVHRAQVAPGDTVVVVGAGPVGILIALVARQAGGDVTVLELDAYRRSAAAGLGFTTLDPATDDVTAAVDAWTQGAGATVAFEVSGAAGGITTAVQVLAVRGRLCLVAIHPRPREVDLHRFFWRELTLVAARLYERSDVERAVELVYDGTIPSEVLISRVVPLAEAASAFAALDEAGSDVMKVLVACSSVEAR